VRSCNLVLSSWVVLLIFSGAAMAQYPKKQHGFKLDFAPAEEFRGTRMFRQANNLAYAYVTSHAAADADGAPNAYSPQDIGKDCENDKHVGLDCPANAGYGVHKQSWWRDVLVPDPNDDSKAYVQKDGPYKGFFIAQTALRHPGGSVYDVRTYVDATKVPYVVIPDGFGALPHVAKQGDVGIATDLVTGTQSAFIVGDAGGGKEAVLGEVSLALLAALGYPHANPRNGDRLPKDEIQYILFPGSHRNGGAKWPRTKADIHKQVSDLLSKTPGINHQTAK